MATKASTQRPRLWASRHQCQGQLFKAWHNWNTGKHTTSPSANECQLFRS